MNEISRRELLKIVGSAGLSEFLTRVMRVLGQDVTGTPAACEPNAESTAEATADATYIPEIDLINRYPLQEIQALPGNYIFEAQLVSIEVGKAILANGILEVHIIGLCKFRDKSGKFIKIALPFGVNLFPTDGTNDANIVGIGSYEDNVEPFEDLAFENASKKLKVKPGDVMGVIFSDSADFVGPDNGIIYEPILEEIYSKGQLDDFRETGAIDKLPIIVFNGNCYPFLLPRDIVQTII